MNIDIILYGVFWSLFTLFIWFDTTAILEYGKLFGLSKLFKLNAYLKFIESNPKVSYFSFMRKYYDNFFVRLITCPPCFNFWIVFTICAIYKDFLVYPLIYVISYTIYIFLKKKNIY